MRFDDEAVAGFPLSFPGWSAVSLNSPSSFLWDRATEFKQRCAGLEIKGVTLHSYRYPWAERPAKAGYPERFLPNRLLGQQ